MKTGKALIREITQSHPQPGQARFWWLGQHGYALRTKRKTLYLDPFLSPHGERLVQAPLSPGEVVNADIVTGSHDHGDHIDREALPALLRASPRCKLIVPKATVP